MALAGMRYEAASKLVELVPSKPVALASTQESVTPSATDFTAETLQSLQIAWNGVIVEIPNCHARFRKQSTRIARFSPAWRWEGPAPGCEEEFTGSLICEERNAALNAYDNRPECGL